MKAAAGPRSDTDAGIVDAMAELSFLVQGLLSRHAAASGLSMIQTRLLGVLRDREPTMQELARALELDKSSVTGLVDRAAARGLVKRSASVDDRRVVRVRLTAVGRRVAGVVERGFAADLTAATDGLSAPERRQLSLTATALVASANLRRAG
jgi:MarR family transcriptional regulator, lower aerobic nicotinate degradation pathway regulator